MNTGTLQDSIAHSLAADHRVTLLVGPPGCGKSRLLRSLKGMGKVNVGTELARELIPLAEDERPDKALDILGGLIDAHSSPVVILDSIELLLRPELKIDLWSALETLSADKKLIVAWTGQVEGRQIQWGQPGALGYRAMSLENCPANIIIMTG